MPRSVHKCGPALETMEVPLMAFHSSNAFEKIKMAENIKSEMVYYEETGFNLC